MSFWHDIEIAFEKLITIEPTVAKAAVASFTAENSGASDVAQADTAIEGVTEIAAAFQSAPTDAHSALVSAAIQSAVQGVATDVASTSGVSEDAAVADTVVQDAGEVAAAVTDPPTA